MSAFDTARYIDTMVAAIGARCDEARGRVLLEVGGHLLCDRHAARVLPGFAPDAKLQVVQTLARQRSVEVCVCAHAADLVANDPIQNGGLPYREAAHALVTRLRDAGLRVAYVVATRCRPEHHAQLADFAASFATAGVVVHQHAHTPGYPDPECALRGFAANSALRSSASVLVVTGVQANAGKLSVCLSELAHAEGEAVLYSKLELFPLWDRPPAHAVNAAYEAATADIGDVVCVDPFHAGGATNYNRDVEAFPILRALMERLVRDSALLARWYSSPTAMGVNTAGACIVDEAQCERAAVEEIARRVEVYRALPAAHARCVQLLARYQGPQGSVH